jgi:hypothetical protein
MQRTKGGDDDSLWVTVECYISIAEHNFTPVQQPGVENPEAVQRMLWVLIQGAF